VAATCGSVGEPPARKKTAVPAAIGNWSGDMAVINGITGNDTLNGGDEADIIRGLEGNDVLHGGGAYDSLDGGEDDDQLFGEGAVLTAWTMARAAWQ
jgi:Ca2+-binding RTX toxin-like protein